MTKDEKDELAITLALLHGCKFLSEGGKLFYVDNCGGIAHPIETANSAQTGMYGFQTREALAHAYCAHYKLGTDLATIKSPHPETHKEEP